MIIKFETDNYLKLEPSKERRPLVLIAPGGAYLRTASREAEPVRDAVQKAGFHAGIIYYRETLLPHPQAAAELARFVAHVRKNADHFNIDSGRIALLGFSAGGHYVASLGVDWEEYGEEARPNALLLAYPVITGKKGLAHEGSLKNLFGKITPETRKKFSLERRAGKHTPPTFLFHTEEDLAVPCENSLLFFEALRKAGVPAEIHVYREGPHGLALANSVTPFEGEDPLAFEKKYARVAGWVELAVGWLKKTFDSSEESF